jgi:hypothetical protein
MNKNKADDRKYLVKLAKALDVSEKRIKKDTYGDWNIVGIRGHISTEGDYWYVYCDCNSVRKWTFTKKQLSFMEIHQDGDDEGILKCSRMPFRDEAKEIRKVIGVRPKRVISEEHRAKLLSFSFPRSKQGVSGDSMRLNTKDEDK